MAMFRTKPLNLGKRYISVLGHEPFSDVLRLERQLHLHSLLRLPIGALEAKPSVNLSAPVLPGWPRGGPERQPGTLRTGRQARRRRRRVDQRATRFIDPAC
jgi:hypothetical protein